MFSPLESMMDILLYEVTSSLWVDLDEHSSK